MPVSAVLGSIVFGAAAYFSEGERRYTLIAAAVPLFSMLPYTRLVMWWGILRIKLILSADEESKAENEGAALVQTWRTQHIARITMAWIGFGAGLYALTQAALRNV
eukprot:TRINITY_DN6624_c0_g1_i1.p2 TRINITY_DN6624_c0_g1~~TRINITY_DN6624_c0_g1_i1.p2  ORF type:complete len:106 (+),score=28.12 TRINITY_DN6624_c0_g1_i1:300-617(+)